MVDVPTFEPPPRTGLPPVSLADATSSSFVARIVDFLSTILQGKLNATLVVTLDASATTTTVLDPRIGYASALLLQPLTANAAIALYETPYILASDQGSGTVTLNHASTADTDKTFNLVILG